MISLTGFATHGVHALGHSFALAERNILLVCGEFRSPEKRKNDNYRAILKIK